MLVWIKYLRGLRVETDALKRNKDLASTRIPLSLVRGEGRRFKSWHSDQKQPKVSRYLLEGTGSYVAVL
jgi:hypothetical protein